MAQTTITKKLCPQCGAEGIENQRFCPNCGEAFLPQDSDATIRVNPRDPDATVRASRSLSPAMLRKAIEKSQETGSQPPSSPACRGAIHSAPSRKRTFVLVGSVICLLLILALIATALLNHSGEASAQQRALQSEAQLNSQLQQVRALGIPASYLQPVLNQEQQIAHAQPLFAPVNPFATGYYTHAAQQYRALQQEVPGIIATATNALQTQAQLNMQAFQAAISKWDAHGVGNSRYFSQQFSQDQLALSSARYPRDYSAISQNAQQSIVALQAMGIVYSQLNDLKTTIRRMGMAHIDVTALQAQYANDLQAFNSATSTTAFQNLGSQIDAQYEQAVVASIQAFPYVGVTKLNELQQQISQLRSYGMNTTYYQQRLSADQLAEQHVNTVYDALLFIKQVDSDITSMYGDLMKGEAHYLVKSFHQQVEAWAKAHPYYDSFDGHTYALDDGYMATGIGNTLDSDLAAATTTADYAAMVNEANNDLFNLHNWFPPTPIKYAILYHYGGDFVHDAWWRQSFGPGTQFPHADTGGNTSYNFDGSHGCINLTTSDAAWVYKNTTWNTVIVVY